MALFCTNICMYDNCGKIFPNLHELICHIEEIHLEFDTKTIEKYENDKTDLIPFSYILKYNRDEDVNELETNKNRNYESVLKVNDIRNNNDVFPEAIEVSSYNEDSSSDVSQYAGKVYGIKQHSHLKDKKLKKLKKYECPVPGCHKRYMNINGIKYHSRNAHNKKQLPYNYKFLKDYKCHCGKAYKTAQGLKAHSLLHNLRNQYDQRNNKSLLELSKFDQQQNTSKCIVETAAQLHIPEYQNDEYVRNWGNNEQFLKDFCNNWL